MEIVIGELSELKAKVTQIIKELPQGLIVVDGAMGAGKTTLIAEICRQFDVTDEPMSPTYPIINEYYSSSYGSIYHIDCYRLESEVEAQNIGMEDYLYSGSYCFVEWADNIKKLLPDNYVRVIVQARENIRIITIDK